MDFSVHRLLKAEAVVAVWWFACFLVLGQICPSLSVSLDGLFSLNVKEQNSTNLLQARVQRTANSFVWLVSVKWRLLQHLLKTGLFPHIPECEKLLEILVVVCMKTVIIVQSRKPLDQDWLCQRPQLSVLTTEYSVSPVTHWSLLIIATMIKVYIRCFA